MERRRFPREEAAMLPEPLRSNKLKASLNSVGWGIEKVGEKVIR